MYRMVGRNLTLDDITVSEGRESRFFSLEETGDADCAANCKKIVVAYFKMYH